MVQNVFESSPLAQSCACVFKTTRSIWQLVIEFEVRRFQLTAHLPRSRADAAIKKKNAQTDGDVYTQAPHRTLKTTRPTSSLGCPNVRRKNPPKKRHNLGHTSQFTAEQRLPGRELLCYDETDALATSYDDTFMPHHHTARWKIWIILWNAYILNQLVVVSVQQIRLNSPPLVNNVDFEKQSLGTLHKTSLFGALFMLFFGAFITDLDIQELICDICSASVHDPY